MQKQYAFLSLATHNKKLKYENFLNEMTKVISCEKLIEVISHYYFHNKKGRKAMDLLMMIKIHCLQQWYNLSGLEQEEAICDGSQFLMLFSLVNLYKSEKKTISYIEKKAINKP